MLCVLIPCLFIQRAPFLCEGAKVVPKAYPEEKVGVFALREGQNVVVEYSELDPEEASATDSGEGSFCAFERRC